MKHDRQSEIVSIITEKQVETQEELSELLRERGYMVTQATVSRDIRELRLVKVSGGAGKYIYAIQKHDENAMSAKFRNLLVETVEKLDLANNIVVVKTIAGMAQGAAAAVDSIGREDIVGSVAGDDTVIIVMRTNDGAQSLVDELDSVISQRKQ